MENTSGKFLVNFINQFSHTDLFFGFWFIVTATFVFLMFRFRRQGDRRNFRDTPYKMKDMRPPGKGLVTQDTPEEQKTSLQKR
ncbi:MAG: hypothetical protein H6617_09965 [Bdellovibrionaceae bacterium]|nr:hypothetical protein [Bdellovibrionales bacterium]MCB9254995.1 hypothetical protein [Pseudobdellovibrionaceae bacterium]